MSVPLIDFMISSPGHHSGMMKPVVAKLVEQGGCQCRLLSLCEFRGLESPVEMFDLPGVEFVRLVPFSFRSASTGGQLMGTSSRQWGRHLARKISWELLLHWRLKLFFGKRPKLVVLPNDAAFPYDLIVDMLNSAEIPFVLMQEGIRFPLPGSEEGDAYGLGGAAAIAVWGEGSANYFRSRGVAPERIVATGNPRFDNLPKMDFAAEAEQFRKSLDLKKNTLLLMSNPIDDQGFCTTQEKYQLIGRFIDEVFPLFENPDFHLLIKLHPREDVAAVQNLVDLRSTRGQIKVLGSCPLYPLFILSKAAIVLASTVGLEALMMAVPLGVLEIPGAGFVYDYVERRVAVALSWERPMAAQVRELLSGDIYDKQAVQAYVKYSLTTIGEATETVVDLIKHLLKGQYEYN